MIQIPYTVRLAALVALAAVMLLSAQRGDRTARMWEYGFLFVAGALGSVYGVLNDAVTVTVSPEYFIVGKGLEPGAGLRSRAIILGAQAGFSAGVIGCAVWQVALRRVPARLRCLRILRRVWIPFASAAALAVLVALACGRTDPLDFHARMAGLLSPAELDRFRVVWWAHVGAYSGLIGGVVAGVCLSRRANAQG